MTKNEYYYYYYYYCYYDWILLLLWMIDYDNMWNGNDIIIINVCVNIELILLLLLVVDNNVNYWLLFND